MLRHKAVKPDSSFAHDATTLENEVSLLRKQEPASPVATVRRNCTSRYAVILIGLVGGWWLLQFPSNWISGVKNECDTSLQEGQGIDASHSGIRNRNQPTTVAPTMKLAKIEEFQPIQITLPACASNPYKSAINEHFPTVVQTAQEWLNHQDAYNQIAEQTIYTHWDHRRFFPFDPMASCKDLQCIGGACSEDRSKIACGMDHLSRLDKCVVYSIGSNNFWEFEQDILKRTNCDVFTFDCTGSLSRFKVPNEERLHFHHICVGAQSLKGKGEEGCTGNAELCGDTWTLEEIQQHLGHSKVDLLKLDIEGWEWPIFDVEMTNATMPMQVLIEIHYGSGLGTIGVVHDRNMSSATDLVRLQSNLLRVGFVTVHRDDNPHCRHCTELTLMRVAC